uniref:Uncharacterized protein n=1 Tax=Octopus bimaculoides TaxID=37653 RepID=A0A0L8H3T6_OCTBM
MYFISRMMNPEEKQSYRLQQVNVILKTLCLEKLGFDFLLLKSLFVTKYLHAVVDSLVCSQIYYFTFS